MKRVYFARQGPGGPDVRVQEIGGKVTALPFYRQAQDFGPRHFHWGDSSPGAKQLAFALTAHVLGNTDRAKDVYEDILRRVVALLPPGRWELPDEILLAQCLLIEQQFQEGPT